MADLIAELLECCREWTAQHPNTRLWFRGQADADWELLPTALRTDFFDIAQHHGAGTIRGRGYNLEGYLNDRFRIDASPHLAHPDDLVQVYLEARHAGVPSRLLDWTTSPLIALFFATAIRSPELDSSGRVVMLNPETNYYFILPNSERENMPPWTPVPEDNEFFTEMVTKQFSVGQNLNPPEAVTYDPNALDTYPHLPLFPTTLGGVLPVLPRYRFQRLSAQRSCFTYHPVKVDGKYFSGEIPEGSHLDTFLVPAEDKAKARDDLRLLGIDAASVWPSPDGVSEAIRTELGLP